MILITDNYLPKFQKLVNRAGSLQPTTSKYLQAKDLYIKSLQSEMESYRHFRNFLPNGNPAEDRISTQLLWDALRYESNSFAAFNNATNNTDNFHSFNTILYRQHNIPMNIHGDILSNSFLFSNSIDIGSIQLATSRGD